MLKLFLPHLVSREGERNQEKRSVVKRIEIPTKHITLPWMEQVTPHASCLEPLPVLFQVHASVQHKQVCRPRFSYLLLLQHYAACCSESGHF